jgi:hypothetical protein
MEIVLNGTYKVKFTEFKQDSSDVLTARANNIEVGDYFVHNKYVK